MSESSTQVLEVEVLAPEVEVVNFDHLMSWKDFAKAISVSYHTVYRYLKECIGLKSIPYRVSGDLVDEILQIKQWCELRKVRRSYLSPNLDFPVTFSRSQYRLLRDEGELVALLSELEEKGLWEGEIVFPVEREFS